MVTGTKQKDKQWTKSLLDVIEAGVWWLEEGVVLSKAGRHHPPLCLLSQEHCHCSRIIPFPNQATQHIFQQN